ncbi:hypothetical protein HYU14_02275 [Candidatus Woesearchaeota archaeon]|nr:hypothetical protein [Candidatus Woesearchaeota archaeon]
MDNVNETGRVEVRIYYKPNQDHLYEKTEGMGDLTFDRRNEEILRFAPFPDVPSMSIPKHIHRGEADLALLCLSLVIAKQVEAFARGREYVKRVDLVKEISGPPSRPIW